MRESDLIGGPSKPQRETERNLLANAPADGPCDRCGVRADVGCKHRPAAGPPPVAMDPRHNKPRRDGRSKHPTNPGRWSFHPPSREAVDEAVKGLFSRPAEE